VNYLFSHEQYLKEEGIFRVPGSVARVEELKNIFQSGHIPKMGVWEVENAASVILNFLKIARLEADDDPFTGPGNMREQFAEANANNDVPKLKDLLRKHSLSKRETLKLLAYLFLRIEELTQYNKMNVYTLSLSFGTQFARCFPNIVKNYASVFPNTIVFGAPFSVALQRAAPSKLPAPLLVSMKFIEESGFGRGEKGRLYVDLDDSKRTKQYIYEFNSGHVVHYLPGDVHCAATIVILFLSSTHICDSLEHQQRLSQVLSIENEKEQVQELELALKAFPTPNLTSLGTLCRHLHGVYTATTREGADLKAICASFGSLSSAIQATIKHMSNSRISNLIPNRLYN